MSNENWIVWPTEVIEKVAAKFSMKPAELFADIMLEQVDKEVLAELEKEKEMSNAYNDYKRGD